MYVLQIKELITFKPLILQKSNVHYVTAHEESRM